MKWIVYLFVVPSAFWGKCFPGLHEAPEQKALNQSLRQPELHCLLQSLSQDSLYEPLRGGGKEEDTVYCNSSSTLGLHTPFNLPCKTSVKKIS